MAELQQALTLREFGNWLKYFAEEQTRADPNAPIDLSNATPEQIRSAFGIR